MPAITQTARATPKSIKLHFGYPAEFKTRKSQSAQPSLQIPSLLVFGPAGYTAVSNDKDPHRPPNWMCRCKHAGALGMFILKVYHKGVRVFLSEHAAEL